MPAKAQWLLKIPQILRELAALEEPVLDRAAVERLFGLKRRQAINLLHCFGGYQAGHAFLVDRLRLIRQVEQLRESPEVAFETRRRVKVGESLEKVRRHAVAARVEIPVPQDVFQRKLSELPEGITLTCGRLEVEFTGVEELLCKLFELSQAAANDFERFQAAVESGKGA